MGVCRSCNKALTDEEAVLKYDKWETIPKPNDRYIELCKGCLSKSGLGESFIVSLEDESEDEALLEVYVDEDGEEL